MVKQQDIKRLEPAKLEQVTKQRRVVLLLVIDKLVVGLVVSKLVIKLVVEQLVK